MLCFALFPALTRQTPLFFLLMETQNERVHSGMTHRNEWCFLPGKNENVECVCVLIVVFNISVNCLALCQLKAKWNPGE